MLDTDKWCYVSQVSAGDLHAFDSLNLSPLAKVPPTSQSPMKPFDFKYEVIGCLKTSYVILICVDLKVAIEISVDHQTVLKPSTLLKMKVHPNLCQNVAMLRFRN